MPKIKRPKAPKTPTKIDDNFTLDVIEASIKEYANFVKVACSEVSKENNLARTRVKILKNDLAELQKEKSLPSRVTAVKKLYDDFAEYVKELPEEGDESEGLKNGDNPKSVKVTGKDSCPKDCDDDYFDTLIAALKKPKTYAYTKTTNSWTPDLGKQTGHADGKNWKAYVDAEEGSGTKWRMQFSMDYDEEEEELTVKINYCKIGH